MIRTGIALVTSLVALCAVVAHSSPAAAKPKGAACGIDFLPLAEGAEWTYQNYVPEGFEPPPGVRVDEPTALTVRVVSVEDAGKETRITVEESYRKVKTQNVLVCTKDHLRVPPESFFFAGQPGGGLGIELKDLKTKGESFLVKGGLKEGTFQEFTATAIRTPTEGSGAVLQPAALEIERKMVVAGRQATESAMGPHKATRVDVQVTGRAALASTKDKKANMPTFISGMWFAPGVGLVRVESNNGQGWLLNAKK